MYLGCSQAPCKIPDFKVQQNLPLFSKYFPNTNNNKTIYGSGATSFGDPKLNNSSEQGSIEREEKKGVTESFASESVKGYQYSMKGHVEQVVDKYLELTGKDVSTLRQVATPCMDDH